MIIGVISDTHDRLNTIDRAMETLEKYRVDMIVHLGDWIAPYTVNHIVQRSKDIGVPLKGVLGNNDGEIFMIATRNPKEWSFELGKDTLVVAASDRTIILYHGTDGRITEGLIKSGEYDAVFSGHTHEPRNEMIETTLALNPGTLSGFSSLRGGHIKQGELAVYDSSTNAAQLLTFPL